MTESKLTGLITGETVTSYFLVRRVDVKLTGTGKKYLDLVLGDAGGEIVARLWDCTPEDESLYVRNTAVKVKGSVVEWQGKKQIKIDRIRLLEAEDGVEIKELVAAAPADPSEMHEKLLDYSSRIEDKDIRKVVQIIIKEAGDRLLSHPAALQNHHAVRSGLLYHTLTMLKAAEKLMEVYTFLNGDLLLAGIILHDIAKIEEIKANEWGLADEYTVEGQLLGHIVQGIKRIARVSREVGLAEEKSVLLEHMILSHHYEPEFGSPKKPMFPEAEVLHYLDILDARMYDMQKALAEVGTGSFSEKIWVLENRRLYKFFQHTPKDRIE